MLDIFDNSWQKTSPISPLHVNNRNHVLSIFQTFFKQDRFRIWVLFINGRAAGFESYFLYNKILFPVMRGYNKKFKRYSPGNLLIKESIFHFHKKGIEGIHYGPFRKIDNTDYKKKWATKIWESPNLLCINPANLYGFTVRLFNCSKLFRKIWWKIKPNS